MLSRLLVLLILSHELLGNTGSHAPSDYLYDDAYMVEDDENFRQLVIEDRYILPNASSDSVSAYLTQPPFNKNWKINDVSSRVRLGYGKILGPRVDSGATFRGNSDMGNTIGSCQFGLLKKNMNYVDSGFNPYLVGVGSYFWKGSSSCGQCLLLRNPKNGRSVVSMITDYCPPPCTSKQLDLHVAGSAFLASGNSLNSQPYRGGPENFARLEVYPVECDWKGERMRYYFDTGSSRFHMYLIVMFQTVPAIKLTVAKVRPDRSVEFYSGSVSRDTYGRWVVEFPKGNAVAGIYRVRHYRSTNQWTTDYVYWNGLAQVQFRGSYAMSLTSPAKNIKNWPL